MNVYCDLFVWCFLVIISRWSVSPMKVFWRRLNRVNPAFQGILANWVDDYCHLRCRLLSWLLAECLGRLHFSNLSSCWYDCIGSIPLSPICWKSLARLMMYIFIKCWLPLPHSASVIVKMDGNRNLSVMRLIIHSCFSMICAQSSFCFSVFRVDLLAAISVRCLW
jgi:hypothetical protein